VDAEAPDTKNNDIAINKNKTFFMAIPPTVLYLLALPNYFHLLLVLDCVPENSIPAGLQQNN